MTLKTLPALFIGCLCLVFAQLASAADTPAQAARKWRTAHESEILKEFTSLLAIPNVASDTANIQRNAETLVAMLKRRLDPLGVPVTFVPVRGDLTAQVAAQVKKGDVVLTMGAGDITRLGPELLAALKGRAA